MPNLTPSSRTGSQRGYLLIHRFAVIPTSRWWPTKRENCVFPREAHGQSSSFESSSSDAYIIYYSIKINSFLANKPPLIWPRPSRFIPFSSETSIISHKRPKLEMRFMWKTQPPATITTGWQFVWDEEPRSLPYSWKKYWTA